MKLHSTVSVCVYNDNNDLYVFYDKWQRFFATLPRCGVVVVGEFPFISRLGRVRSGATAGPTWSPSKMEG